MGLTSFDPLYENAHRTNMRTVRLIVDEPGDGAWNMAVDDVLLAAAAERGEATLRFYGWSPATLSLGYFQAFDAREQHPPSRHCPVVRRASGGGAIVHDRELTYSLALPYEHWREHGRTGLYSLVHRSLCEALVAVGIEHARMIGDDNAKLNERKPAEPPFLCFERRTEFDVVLSPPGTDAPQAAKIAGSAQRSLHRAVLQHGSILLARSEFAPSLPGISEIAGTPADGSRLVAAWLPRLAAQLDAAWSPDEGFADSAKEAILAAAEKFRSDDWLRRR
ncbi:MAG: lipoate--protein ligase family protein [Planctomycetota bacterium]|nr:MAG: lipoate--protein ligase family protein [Planctomycetota bacterium]